MARYIGEQMIMAEWLFVETVADVRRRSHDPAHRSRYELLGIAPLLRKLLLDGSPLLETVRAERSEIPVEFRIRPWNASDQEIEREGLQRHLGLSGEELVGGANDPPATSLEDFKRVVVGVAEGKDLTVRSVVRYYAHVEGGVHFGLPKEPGEATLSGMSSMLLGRSTGQIEILAHIGRVVVDALTPLFESVLAEPTIDRRLHIRNEQGFFEGHWTTEFLVRTGARLLPF